MTTRYAIYFVPERESDLFKNASQWLGWDCQNAVKIDQPTHPQIELSEITSSPKVYGFHATLKPPFELFGSLSEDDLLRAADKFSHAIKPIYELEFELNTLGSFLALTPKNRMSDIHRLAAAVVQGFDHFRKPMEAEEFARRNKPGLSEGQRAHLKNWGYPYVLDEFRFHMTLTNSLGDEMLNRVAAFLSNFLGNSLKSCSAIDRLSVLKQQGKGEPFRLIHTAPFAD